MIKPFSVGQPVVYTGDRHLDFAGLIIEMIPRNDGHYWVKIRERSGHIRKDPSYLLAPMKAGAAHLSLVKA